MKKHKLFISYTILIFSVSAAFSKVGDTLSLSDCISLALRNNPQVKSSQGTTQSGNGVYLASRSALLPQLSAQVKTAGNSGQVPSSAIGRIVTGPTTPAYEANVQASQLIYDFGKTSLRASAARSLLSAAQYDSNTTIQNLILGAITAYITMIENRLVVKINDDALAQAKSHYDKAEILFEAGRGVRYDVVKAQVDVANAELNLIKSKNVSQTSFLQLCNIIGDSLNAGVILTDSLFAEKPLPTLDSAISIAFQNRTELLSLKMKAQATQATTKAAHLGRLPSISGTAGYGLKGADFKDPQLQQSWSIGASVSIPIFTGLAQTGAIEQAAGAQKSAESAFLSTEQAVILDIEQQLSSCREASERVKVGAKAVEMAQLALSLSQERFNSGNGNAIEVSDAEIAFGNSKIAEIQARCDYRIAYAKLLKAMGAISFPLTTNF